MFVRPAPTVTTVTTAYVTVYVAIDVNNVYASRDFSNHTGDVVSLVTALNSKVFLVTTVATLGSRTGDMTGRVSLLSFRSVAAESSTEVSRWMCLDRGRSISVSED